MTMSGNLACYFLSITIPRKYRNVVKSNFCLRRLQTRRKEKKERSVKVNATHKSILWSFFTTRLVKDPKGD